MLGDIRKHQNIIEDRQVLGLHGALHRDIAFNFGDSLIRVDSKGCDLKTGGHPYQGCLRFWVELEDGFPALHSEQYGKRLPIVHGDLALSSVAQIARHSDKVGVRNNFRR